jgi:hypothetical protein
VSERERKRGGVSGGKTKQTLMFLLLIPVDQGSSSITSLTLIHLHKGCVTKYSKVGGWGSGGQKYPVHNGIFISTKGTESVWILNVKNSFFPGHASIFMTF